MQNLWLKKCKCGKSAIEFRSRKDLYVDSVRQVHCPKCLIEVQPDTLMLYVRKWGSSTSKESNIGLYGVLYNKTAILNRNTDIEWGDDAIMQVFNTGMVRPNLLSTNREGQDYKVIGIYKDGERVEDYKSMSTMNEILPATTDSTSANESEQLAVSDESRQIQDISNLDTQLSSATISDLESQLASLSKPVTELTEELKKETYQDSVSDIVQSVSTQAKESTSMPQTINEKDFTSINLVGQKDQELNTFEEAMQDDLKTPIELSSTLQTAGDTTTPETEQPNEVKTEKVQLAEEDDPFATKKKGFLSRFGL